MAVAEDHPSVEELAAFTLGTLDEETQASIEAHVAACTSCQERAINTPGDSFVELLRSALVCTSRCTDTFVEAAAQVQTPVPLAAVAVTDALALAVAPSASAESDRPEVPDALPPELAHHERYRIVRFLGAGGMGAVYEAEHRVMHKPVALKVIKRAYTARADALERFRYEMRAAARLSHPNIVTTHDAEDTGETHFLVMEYVEGPDLGRLVQDGGSLPVDRASEYVRQAALGLQYAFEQGMVHRDLKPHNLMLTPDGRVKILDFGLVRFASEAADAAGVTGTGMVLGSVDYIAPEQADHAHEADTRSDIYSLGCTLYHLLAGRPPFPTGTPLQKVMAHVKKKPQPLTELRQDIPEELMHVIDRMMAKNPKHRYQTPAEVAVVLEPFTFAPTARDPGRTVVLPDISGRRRRERRFLIATAILAFLVAGLLGVAVYRIATDKGELVIQTDNDDVEVVVSKGGKVEKIIDTNSGKHVTLNSGDYELALKDGQEGLKLSPGKMTLKRGETVLATITRVTPGQAKAEQVDEVRRFVGHTGSVHAIAYSPDGRFALSGGGYPDGDGTLRMWDVATGKEIRRIRGHMGHVQCVAFSPDGHRVLSGGGNPDCTVCLWNTFTGTEIHREQSCCQDGGVSFSPDGRQILIGRYGADHVAALLDSETWKVIRTFELPSWVVSAVFSRDGKRVLMGSAPRQSRSPLGRRHVIRLWDVETGGMVQSFGAGEKTFVVCALSPDGRYVLSGDHGEKNVRLWEVETGKPVREFQGHEGGVHSVAFSPDGRRALSGSHDRTLRLWDVETGKEWHCFKGHSGDVWSVAFSPDGRYALSGSGDGTVRLWRLPDPPPAKKNP
jgi:serine/threonine protein kinase